MSGQNLTRIQGGSKIRAMEDLTLGKLVLARMVELGLDLEGVSSLTGISVRHLRRIVEDEGFSPQSATAEKLTALGLSHESIAVGAARCKLKVLRSKLEPANAGV